MSPTDDDWSRAMVYATGMLSVTQHGTSKTLTHLPSYSGGAKLPLYYSTIGGHHARAGRGASLDDVQATINEMIEIFTLDTEGQALAMPVGGTKSIVSIKALCNYLYLSLTEPTQQEGGPRMSLSQQAVVLDAIKDWWNYGASDGVDTDDDLIYRDSDGDQAYISPGPLAERIVELVGQSPPEGGVTITDPEELRAISEALKAVGKTVLAHRFDMARI